MIDIGTFKGGIRNLQMNAVIRTLAIGDSLVWFGWFLFSSIVALHLEERLGTSVVLSIANGAAIYFIVRATFQIPFSKFMDSNKSYHDEISAMLLGGVLMSLSFLGYEFVQTPTHLYLVNALFGIAAAIYLPAWRKTYARFIDKGREGQNYAMADSMLTLAGAIASFAGGVITELTGTFMYVFLVSSLFTLIGGLSMLTLLKETE